MPLPALPARQTPWSSAARNAFMRINTVYDTSSAYLEAASFDPHRLKGYMMAIVTDVFPIVLLLEESAIQEGIPAAWLENIANKFTELFGILTESLQTENLMPAANVIIPETVLLSQTGKRGRPKKVIDPDVLQNALRGDRRISITALANVLGVHRNTLREKIKELDISTGYDNLEDEDLDNYVRLNRASFMWGSSVFNTRIERVWVESGKRFVEEWNSHPIGGLGGNQSPNDMMLLGQLERGIYDDPCDSMTEDEINAFFGFEEDGEPSDESDGHESSGNISEDEEDFESDDEFEDSRTTSGSNSDNSSGYSPSSEILDTGFDTAEVIDSNIRHDAVPVPKKACPFDERQLEMFEKGLHLLREAGDVPNGYGVNPSEWDQSGYPTTEVITVGLRKNSFPISLPASVWLPRAQDWARALVHNLLTEYATNSRGSGMAKFAAIMSTHRNVKHAATQESSRGMKAKNKSKGKQKAKVPARLSVADPSNTFRVGKIVFLIIGIRKTNGYEYKKEAITPVYATKKEVDVSAAGLIGLLQCNLCKVSDDGFLFSTDDSFDEVDAVLRSHFPLLFAYLDSHRPSTGPAYDAGLSQWLICIKRAGRKPGVLVFSGDRDGQLPNGNDIVTSLIVNKKSKTHFKEATLFLITREQIPIKVAKKWAVESNTALERYRESLGHDSAASEDPLDFDSDDEVDEYLARRIPSQARPAPWSLSLVAGPSRILRSHSGTMTYDPGDIISLLSDDASNQGGLRTPPRGNEVPPAIIPMPPHIELAEVERLFTSSMLQDSDASPDWGET
ncbi:hypothetical protein HYPSUDRAFT_52392 [Hypholoma sublateritium FD-334 SS-4]|uniref:Uncharacterized protein n=1 Tax=Hypholoma sublateritium (strain FD-334 SS-4) TaxID=945553 RepID=A0A0D2Q4D5_HYPSF|nr:hypothetical protein HYPSUDRAFT_52392 [Hypholoma sublateritium FD-334 SS-4]